MRVAYFGLASILGVLGALSLSSSSGATHSPLFAVLSGGNEVDMKGMAAKGDSDAYGSATVILNSAKNTLCFALAVDNVDPLTAAHIHKGTAGMNGPVVVPLTAPMMSPGASSGCVTIEPALLKDIQDKSTGYYINLHNPKFKDGALRGQLH
jgi:hypothetical protein